MTWKFNPLTGNLDYYKKGGSVGEEVDPIFTTWLEANDGSLIVYDVPCDSSVFVTAAVRMFSGVAYNAQADSMANSNFIGIIENKGSSILCDIRVSGITAEIFTGLDETKEYYLSDINPGEITTSIPTNTNSIMLKVGQPFSDKKFLVNKGQRIKRA